MSSNEEIERLYFQMMQETQPPQPLFMNPNELHSANYLDPPLLTTSDQPDPAMDEREDTPESIDDSLKPLYNEQGGLADIDAASRLGKIFHSTAKEHDKLQSAGTASEETINAEKERLLLVLMKTDDVEIMKKFLDTKGFLIFKHWLVEAKKEKKLPQFVMSLLNVLDHLPIGIDELTKSGLGKVVRVFGKGSFPEEIKKKALYLIDSWTKLLSAPTSTDSKPSIKPEPTTKPSQKRKASTAATSAAPSKKPTAPTTSTVTSTFNPFASSALPKFKKSTITPTPRIPIKITRKSSSSDDPSPITPTNPVEPTPPIPIKQEPVLRSYRKAAADIPKPNEPTMFEDMVVTVPLASAVPSKSIVSTIQTGVESTGAGKKKRKVTFAPDDQLCQVKLFKTEKNTVVPSLGDDEQFLPHELGNARDFERSEGIHAKKRNRMELVATIDWKMPSELIINETNLSTLSTTTPETRVQDEREKKALSVIYYNDQDIPISPDESEVDQTTNPIHLVQEIPVHEVVVVAAPSVDLNQLINLARLQQIQQQQPITSQIQQPIQQQQPMVASQMFGTQPPSMFVPQYQQPQPASQPALLQYQILQQLQQQQQQQPNFQPPIAQPLILQQQQQQYLQRFQQQAALQHQQQRAAGKRGRGGAREPAGGKRFKGGDERDRDGVCRYWRGGSCEFGNECRNRHDRE